MEDSNYDKIRGVPKRVKKVSLELPWTPEEIQDLNSIPKGDMPDDKIMISPNHIQKAQLIFPRLLELLIPVLDENTYRRVVVAICGGSGVGKSEIASLITYYINRMGIGCYTLSGDNYPYRIPKYNDIERIRIFRQSGVRGLISHGQYTRDRNNTLKELQESDNDSNPNFIKSNPWLSIYRAAGCNGLRSYLGTTNEIDFAELTGIVSQFKNGASQIFLKRMGRNEMEIWYERVSFSDKNVMVIEWTHGNSHNLQGVDIPILLNSTPQETLAHRVSRKRDDKADSPFTAIVLEIEQEMLVSQASKAKLIVSKSGEILSYDDYIRIMMQEKL